MLLLEHFWFKMNYKKYCPFCKNTLHTKNVQGTFANTLRIVKNCFCNRFYLSYQLFLEDDKVIAYLIKINNDNCMEAISSENKILLFNRNNFNEFDNPTIYDFYIDLDLKDPIKFAKETFERLINLKEFQ
jgi:hypothetical protein